MDKYVYISYSRHDHGFVEQLSGDLRSHGISIWVDMESIEPGENWEHAIVKGIQGASVFLLVLSKSSIQSNSVRSELEIAEEAGLIIIPLAVDEIELPAALQYQLAGGQEISFAGNYTKGKDLLLTSLESILKIDTSIEQSVEKPEIRSKGYVFISYAEEDTDFVSELKKYLAKRKYAYWDYQESERDYHLQLFLELEGVIKDAAATLSVLSEDWKRSTWAVKEYFFSDEVGTPVFLLKAKAIGPTLAITGIPYIDFTQSIKAGFEKLDLELNKKGL